MCTPFYYKIDTQKRKEPVTKSARDLPFHADSATHSVSLVSEEITEKLFHIVHIVFTGISVVRIGRIR